MAHTLLRQGDGLSCPFEVIVGDDGSTDQSVRAALSKLEGLPHFKLFTSRRNLGRSAIRNQLGRMASNDNLLFLDSDGEIISDTFLADYCSQIDRFDVVCGGIIHTYEYSKKSWEKITEVVKTTPYYGIDMIIPTGTAIQNARSTNLNSPHGLTRDGKHLGFGVGLYVAACTWFEALIAPVFGVSVLGNTSTHEITEWERSHSKFETSAVTNQNRTLCQQCAVTAVATPYVTAQ